MLGIVGPLIPDDTILVLSGIAAHEGRLEPGMTIGIAFAQMRLDRDDALSFFGTKPERAIDAYKVFCSATGLARSVPRQPP